MKHVLNYRAILCARTESQRGTGSTGSANMADSTLKAVRAGNMATKGAQRDQEKKDKSANLDVGNAISAASLYAIAVAPTEDSKSEQTVTNLFISQVQSSTEQKVKDALKGLPAYYATEATAAAMKAGKPTAEVLELAKSAKKTGANWASRFRKIYQAGKVAGSWDAFAGMGRLTAERHADSILKGKNLTARGTPVVSKEERDKTKAEDDRKALYGEADAIATREGKVLDDKNLAHYKGKAIEARRIAWATEVAKGLCEKYSESDLAVLQRAITEHAMLKWGKSAQAKAA